MSKRKTWSWSSDQSEIIPDWIKSSRSAVWDTWDQNLSVTSDPSLPAACAAAEKQMCVILCQMISKTSFKFSLMESLTRRMWDSGGEGSEFSVKEVVFLKIFVPQVPDLNSDCDPDANLNLLYIFSHLNEKRSEFCSFDAAEKVPADTSWFLG